MNFGLLLYPDVEPIDLAAIGVVSMARRIIPELGYVTIASSLEPVRLSNGLRVLPDFGVDEAHELDVLIVPGGPGWKDASADPRLIAYLQTMAANCVLCSVCTGAMLLAAAGLLEGKSATTKVEVVPPEQAPLQVLEAQYAGTKTHHALIVDEGQVVTGGGVSLCIDTVLYLLERKYGSKAVGEVARILEYQAAREANHSRLDTLIAHQSA